MIKNKFTFFKVKFDWNSKFGLFSVAQSNQKIYKFKSDFLLTPIGGLKYNH